MASNTRELADIIQHHLECPICCERFKQPKLLECSHSFCLECLQQLRENSPSTTKLSCPECQQETVLKENGIEGLKTDFKSISLMEAFQEQETQLKQQQGQVPSQDLVSKCSKHTDKDLVLYCNKCKALVCLACIAKDHNKHSLIERNEALNQSTCKQHAKELLSEIRQIIKSFNIASHEIDISCKTLDSMFAATKEKISKKADREIARIQEQKQKIIQEAERIYQDRVKAIKTAQATNSKKINKAQHKVNEVNQLMDQGLKIHIEHLMQDLKEYRDMTSTKLPDGLTYMDFKEGQKSLGRLLLKDIWTMEARIETDFFYPGDVTTYSNSDIVASHEKCLKLLHVPSSADNPESEVIPQELPIRGLTKQSRVTVNKNDELIVLDNGAVKIFNRICQLTNQFRLGRLFRQDSSFGPDHQPTCLSACIAVDHNNLIAVGYKMKKPTHDYNPHRSTTSNIRDEISLHKPDGSLIRTLPAPGIDEHLTIHKQRFIYTNCTDRKLVSVDYNGHVAFSVDTPQSEWPLGVCCDLDGSIYVGTGRNEIHQYSPDGKYIGCIIKDCVWPYGMTVTPAGDLVVAGDSSVQIYHHE